MTTYRDRLPQLGTDLFLTDGGLETTLIFHDGLELPSFAAFVLLASDAGTDALRGYFRRHASVARERGLGFVLESPTWRANPDWAARLGWSPEALDEANRNAVALMHELRAELAAPGAPMVVSGCIGPRGDGYDPGRAMSYDEAQGYHGRQIGVLAGAGVDLVTAITMTNVPEAVGVARAARAAGVPSAISFTVETDGRLPSGATLREAIADVDTATGASPAYYMVNCAHPTHFAAELAAGAAWARRIRGLRANASCLSHAELDNATELDSGDPVDLARRYADLLRRQPQITVLGGCCGTDHRHIEEMATTCIRAVVA